jgi:ATP-dependent RNA helicase DHX40
LINSLCGHLEQQRAIFEPAGKGVRKVIVGTNIAGTSLTIDGIRYVVDSGFVKQLSYNPRTGLDALSVVSISKSEATQRSGRAGRTAPGKCFRLYSEEFYNCMEENTVPEIQRTNLTSVVLSLKCLGVRDVLRFHYIDKPEERMLLEALRQLYIFEALDKHGEVTVLGQQMVEFPLSPGLARALIRSAQLGCEDAMLPIAAMLSVENVFVRSAGKDQSEMVEYAHRRLATQAGGSNDFATLLCIYQKCHQSDNPKKWCSEHFIHWRALKMAIKVQEQLSGILNRLRVRRSSKIKDSGSDKGKGSLSERVRQAICAGFFCNVARKSNTGLGFRSMDGHGSVLHIHPSSAVGKPVCIAVNSSVNERWL